LSEINKRVPELNFQNASNQIDAFNKRVVDEIKSTNTAASADFFKTDQLLTDSKMNKIKTSKIMNCHN